MRVQIFWSGFWILEELLDISLNTCSNILFNFLEFFLGGPGIFKEHVFNKTYWISVISHMLDFLSGSVSDTWVRHGVTVISISHVLNEHWSILNAELLGPLHSLSDHQDVLSITLETWNFVTSLVIFGVVSSTCIGGSHTIKVVLAEEDTWKFPESSHVGGLKKLTLVSSTISVHGNSDVGFTLVLKGKSQSCTYGNLSSNNTVTTVEIILSVIVMHGSSLATA